MILKGSQRGGARALPAHLTNTNTNDHFEVADIRGLAATSLEGAFLEIEATSKATKASQPLFCVSFNPPQNVILTFDQFEAGFAAVERKLGLSDQPRAVVYHEKEGRRHAHVVWSRIDVESMKALPMSHFKMKLGDVALQLCNEFGIEPPKGLLNAKEADQRNYNQRTWQQASRLGEDPRDLKKIIREAYERSDTIEGFTQQLEHHALVLARGDRRDFVIVHHSGELLSATRYIGERAKTLRSRFGDAAKLPTIKQAKDRLRSIMTADSERRLSDMRKRHAIEIVGQRERVKLMKSRQRQERSGLAARQGERERAEVRTRADRLRALDPRFWDKLRRPYVSLDRIYMKSMKATGRWIANLADKLTGREKQIADFNRAETIAAQMRDRSERQTMIEDHLKSRQDLQVKILAMRVRHLVERSAHSREMANRLIEGRVGRDFAKAQAASKKLAGDTSRHSARRDGPGAQP